MGFNPAQIACELGRSASTLSRELKRQGWVRPKVLRSPGRPQAAGGYRADAAHKRANVSKIKPRTERRLQPGNALWGNVMAYLKAGYSSAGRRLMRAVMRIIPLPTLRGWCGMHIVFMRGFLAARLAKPDLYDLLKMAGVARLQSKEHYGLALVLGGGEVTLEELAQLYAMLANGGMWRPLNYQMPTSAACRSR